MTVIQIIKQETNMSVKPVCVGCSSGNIYFNSKFVICRRCGNKEKRKDKIKEMKE